MDLQFKPFRYLQPKPRQYMDLRDCKPKNSIKESKSEEKSTKRYENIIGLISIVIILGSTGLMMKTCNDYLPNLEQKVGEYYHEESRQQYYNLPDYYFK